LKEDPAQRAQKQEEIKGLPGKSQNYKSNPDENWFLLWYGNVHDIFAFVRNIG